MIKGKKIEEEFRRSEQSQREWCRNNSEKRGTLCYWLERQEELSEGKKSDFQNWFWEVSTVLGKPSEIYISSANADMRKGLDGFVSIKM